MSGAHPNPLSFYASTAICVGVGALHYVLTNLARQFEDMFAGSGAELPALTRILLPDSVFYWIVPGIVAIVMVSHHLGRLSRPMTLWVTSISNVVSVVLCSVGLYLPIFRLGSIVGG